MTSFGCSITVQLVAIERTFQMCGILLYDILSASAIGYTVGVPWSSFWQLQARDSKDSLEEESACELHC